jgi:hypothetical protein
MHLLWCIVLKGGRRVSVAKIPLIFYCTAAGGEPVRAWLKGLDEEERQAIGKDLLRAQWR